MPLSPKLESKLAKVFAPSQTLHDTYQGLDLTFMTNDSGEPVTLFIGKRQANGAIKGERYVRKLVKDAKTGKVVKSHWDLKGKVSGH